MFAAAIVTISLIGSRPSGSGHAEPVAPGFTVAALGHPGERIALSEYAGRPLIVNFWASWCEPCQRETPLLAHWYAQQHEHVIVVGLDVNDTAANALRFAHAKGVSYPLGFDPNATTAGTFSVIALPQTFFLNAQHRIVDRVFGAVTQADLSKGVRLMDAAGSSG